MMKGKKTFALGLPRTVVALGMVSLFTDLGSEMIYPLLPLFLTTVIGAGAASLGIIEGVAESTASLLKVVGGYLSDRSGKRKGFIIGGYGVSGFCRPLIAFAGSWPMVLFLRFLDRVGKGVRTAPRDALIADVTDRASFGAAYGFHRAMDHLGAVLGPLAAAGLLALGLSLQRVFILAIIPSFVVMGIILWGVKEEPEIQKEPPSKDRAADKNPLPSSTKKLLVAMALFTLGNSSDAFLLLRLSDGGLDGSHIALLWSAHHVVKMAGAYLGGKFSDRVGRKPLIACGWLFYSLVYAGFALFTSPTALILIFLSYGVYYGLTEPAQKAWIADLSPHSSRGRGFGWLNGVIGIAALPASLLFGVVWKAVSPAAAFTMGAVLALLATGYLLLIPSPNGAGELKTRG